MHEQLAHSIEIHLLYASIVWIAAWLLTSMQRGAATAKYWIWVATSLNFLLPLSLVPDRFWPSRFGWFTPDIGAAAQNAIFLSGPAIAVFSAVWSVGAAAMFARLCVRIRADRRGAHQTPAVVGLLRPQISLPAGIDRLLTKQELDAVLIHELQHARRRDNLIRLIHEVTLCALWFHPFVWITGSRLALYRELSCDESVTQRAHGGDLVSALAKLASPGDPLLLQASASSFIRHRLAQLTAPHPPRTTLGANMMMSAAFIAVLAAAVAGPVAQSAASYACALTHAPKHGLKATGSGRSR